ncbi:MAG: nicotinate-nucleotide--dimethylbenzimidazole phosphoribosyltransferase [Bacteroidetes bacterium]|nr:MAG: nicotinate-nucleotide--dimethylbenzimidazole phosphoribosyltransferase [Bacteroidota bacterium]
MKTTLTTKLQQELHHKISGKTKPPGSLGRLEDIAMTVGLIQGSISPSINFPHIIVFAGDHGIAATGLVNPYPQSVTAQMVLNFIHGGAAINVFCRQHGIQLLVVDAGVNYEFDESVTRSSLFVDAKIGYGTRNYLEETALTSQQVNAAIAKGKEIVAKVHSTGCNCIGFGEMGIGNTSSASLIMAASMGLPVEACVGKGTGANQEQMDLKIKTLQEAFNRRAPLMNHPLSALEILSNFGGYEVAMMVGAYLEASRLKMVTLVDGFISTAAFMIAYSMDPRIMMNSFFAHTSEEQGHEKMLKYLRAKPLLNLHMRLGEGTGAALAIPIIQSAVNFLNEMASFESAGVDNKN